MRTDSYRRDNVEAEYWEWTGSDDNRDYSYNRKITGYLVLSTSTRATLFTKEPLQWFSILRNIMDRNSTKIYENVDWTVTWVRPSIDIYGMADGFIITIAMANAK